MRINNNNNNKNEDLHTIPSIAKHTGSGKLVVVPLVNLISSHLKHSVVVVVVVGSAAGKHEADSGEQVKSRGMEWEL